MVRALAGELRSCKPCGAAKKKKEVSIGEIGQKLHRVIMRIK